MNAIKDFQRIVFSSAFDPENGTNYELKIESTSNTGQHIHTEAKLAVTMFFDEFGYLHRYKVREALEETLDKFVKSR